MNWVFGGVYFDKWILILIEFVMIVVGNFYWNFIYGKGYVVVVNDIVNEFVIGILVLVVVFIGLLVGIIVFV